MVDLLTEQIAGLYDPKAHEFYIADWIAPEDQRTVMSHELTHALQDQHFQIEAWVKAARPNDDAEMARESVLEGSAMAGMLEYMLQDKGLKLRDLPDMDLSAFVGDLSETPMLKKAPPFIKDSLMFPYFTRAHLFHDGSEERWLARLCRRICAPSRKHPANHAPRTLPLRKIPDAHQARPSERCSQR